MSAALVTFSSVAIRSSFGRIMARTALCLTVIQALLLSTVRAETYDVTQGVPVRIWGSA